MLLRTGTSGFSYSGWKGVFYPKSIKAGSMLEYYASRLGTVEINNTFYRLPDARVLLAWKEQVPDGFLFCLKAPRRITHFQKLVGCEALLQEFFESVAVLEEQLGPVLFQLPPNFPKNVSVLASFAEVIPSGIRSSIEFRHPSWFCDEVYELLASYRIAVCSSDETDHPEARRLEPTSDFGYMRLRQPTYTDAELTDLATRVQRLPWKHAFAFFKHDAQGPLLAENMARLLSAALGSGPDSKSKAAGA